MSDNEQLAADFKAWQEGQYDGYSIFDAIVWATERARSQGWIRAVDRMPPDGELVFTAHRKPKAVNGLSYGYGSWSETNDSMPSAKSFKNWNHYWMAIPKAPQPPQPPQQS